MHETRASLKSQATQTQTQATQGQECAGTTDSGA